MASMRFPKLAGMLLVSIIVVPNDNSVRAFNTSTHALLNLAATHHSAAFDAFLQDSLGFRSGRLTVLRADGESLPIQAWIGRGGVREDDLLRFLRHFHDPLKPWALAGLNLRVSAHESSVRWMQQEHQAGLSTGDAWSWRDARRLYYEALTEPDAARREARWAALFRSLGQLMHLVADASIPEHTRNDMHPLGGFTSSSSYEYWVSGQHATPQLETAFISRFLSAPIGFIPDILQQPAPSDEPVAKVPVARLIDADRYDGGNASVTVHPVDSRAPVPAGIAEIANANFYSEDTLRGTYPSPTDQGLIRVSLDTPLGLVRRYWSRPAGLGLLPANPLRAECASEAYAGAESPYPCVDSVVWGQVAAHMLPRAVGYASGVLDYFFRGAVSVTQVEWTPAGVVISVKNTGTESMDGVFEVYARHRPGTATESRTRLAVLGQGNDVFVGPGSVSTFALPIPAETVPAAAHVLVFRGRLGLEEEAVVGQVFTVPYLEVRQTAYDADLEPVCDRPPAAVVSPPYPSGVTTTIQFESMHCESHVVNHAIHGTLETNTWTDPDTGHREPILARIEARWVGGDVPGSVPLMLDGRWVGSVWERHASEPDPLTFAIADPVHRGRSVLCLLVTYSNGTSMIAQIAVLSEPSSSHGKQLILDNRTPSAPEYLVSSSRAVSGFVAYNWEIDGLMRYPLFEPVSHGGLPAPIDTRTERRFGNRIFREGLRITGDAYSENAFDDFDVFASGDIALERYEAIEPLISPHPDGPVYIPVAEVRRRYQPVELEFLRAFVTRTPEPFVIRLTARGD